MWFEKHFKTQKVSIISRSIWGSDFVMKKPLHLKNFQVIAQYRQDTAKTCPGDNK